MEKSEVLELERTPKKLVQHAQVLVSVYLQLFHVVNAVVSLGH